MGCGASKSNTDLVTPTPGVKEDSMANGGGASEAMAMLAKENDTLRKANAALGCQVQELQQQFAALAADLANTKQELQATSAAAYKAQQVAQAAQEAATLASAAISVQARPITPGPIPLPGNASTDQRMQQMEMDFRVLKEEVEGLRAAYEFQKQLKAAGVEGGLVGSASGRSASGDPGAPASSEMLPPTANFPGGRFGPARASRDRAPQQRPAGAPDMMSTALGSGSSSSGPPAPSQAFGQAPAAGRNGSASGSPSPDLNSTHIYGGALPSDHKFAEQRKGPRQGW